ncbi:MAG: RluA family pseudouridine synthase [Treponema sp.]|jgi:23S rRNA pseudouridine1911/1915/1917 synthase|nr:RluA family pseudouridine synthase [Treponema sp.]
MPGYAGLVPEAVPQALRLDRYVAEYLGLFSRSQCKARKLEARINGKPVKLSRMLKTQDLLELSWTEPDAEGLIPEAIPLRILYEDDRVAVVNKAQGMVVHPGAGNPRGTLANALCYRKLLRSGRAPRAGGIPSAESGGPRPGIVHRLDKDTSGVIIAAYDDAALAFLSEQFKTRKVRKVYGAVVRGAPPLPAGRIAGFLARDPRNRKLFAPSVRGGKPALTYYRVIRSWAGYSLLRLRPLTGRTHQLRTHLRHLGCPILGDPLYGVRDARFPQAALMLHAKTLSIIIPGESRRRDFKTRLPRRFRDFIRGLER